MDEEPLLMPVLVVVAVMMIPYFILNHKIQHIIYAGNAMLFFAMLYWVARCTSKRQASLPVFLAGVSSIMMSFTYFVLVGVYNPIYIQTKPLTFYIFFLFPICVAVFLFHTSYSFRKKK